MIKGFILWVHASTGAETKSVIKKERMLFFYLCLFTVFYLALLGAKQKELLSNETTFVHSSEAECIGNYIWKSIFLHQKHYDTADLILLSSATVLSTNPTTKLYYLKFKHLYNY